MTWPAEASTSSSTAMEIGSLSTSTPSQSKMMRAGGVTSSCHCTRENDPRRRGSVYPLSVSPFGLATSPPLREGEDGRPAWLPSSPPSGGEVSCEARRRGGRSRIPQLGSGCFSAYRFDSYRPQHAAIDMIGRADGIDRKSTRLNSSHVETSYAVFCLKKKKIPVGLRPLEQTERFLEGKGRSMLGDVDTDNGPALVYDALVDPDLALELLALIAPGVEA